MNVVPELSDRWTTVIVELGRLAPKFMLAILGSFHWVILPWKIIAATVALSFRPVDIPFTL